MLGSRVRFGFAAGEGSAFRVSLHPPAPAAGTGGSLAALVSQEPVGLWPPLASCCSTSSEFSSCFVLRSHLNGKVHFAFGSCSRKFELRRVRKNHQWEPGWSLTPAEPQHSALPTAASAPARWVWPQSPVFQTLSVTLTLQGNQCWCHRRRDPSRRGGEDLRRVRSPRCGRLFSAARDAGRSLPRLQGRHWLATWVAAPCHKHGSTQCPQPLCRCPPSPGSPTGPSLSS